MLRQTLCRLAPLCPFHLPFSSYCNVAQAQSYFASTVPKTEPQRDVRILFNSVLNNTFTLRVFRFKKLILIIYTPHQILLGPSN
jgi:hypothetical protein